MKERPSRDHSLRGKQGTRLHIRIVLGALMLVASSSCGVVQFNGWMYDDSVATTRFYGAHWASGQLRDPGGSGHNVEYAELGDPTWGADYNAVGAVRPPVRARMSVGVPFLFETNVSTASPGPKTARAGDTSTAGTLGKVGNRDLNLMRRQADPNDVVF